MIKKTNNLTGKIVVFGGVYSNFKALEKMQKIIDSLNISAANVICTGDVVGYCAEAEKCVQLVKKWGIKCIAGNVEIQLAKGEGSCGCDFEEGSRCDSLSQKWYPFAQQNLTPSSINWMRQLPHYIQFYYGKYRGIVVHGTWQETAAYIFKSTKWEVKQKVFDETNSDVVIAGHSGLPFSQTKNNKYWLNSGALGMPANDGTNRVWYLIIELAKDGDLEFSHRYFNYPHEKTVQLMLENNLPAEYAKTLSTGIWDNCEILPLDEEKLQGISIKL